MVLKPAIWLSIIFKMSFPFNINTNLTHPQLVPKGSVICLLRSLQPCTCSISPPLDQVPLSHSPQSFQSSRGSRAVRRVTIHRRACCEGNTVLCLQGVWFPAVGGRERTRAFLPKRSKARGLHVSTNWSSLLVTLSGLLGGKPPENHCALSSSSSPAEKSSCSRFICSIFSRGISLRF